MPSPETTRRVARCVGEVLALDPEKVSASSRLMQELGADSLDLVELMYLLEQEFEITLGKEDLSLAAQLGLPEAEIHQHEVLTPRALELLRARFPWATDVLVDGISRKHLAALITVEEVATSVERRLAAKQALSA